MVNLTRFEAVAALLLIGSGVICADDCALSESVPPLPGFVHLTTPAVNTKTEFDVVGSMKANAPSASQVGLGVVAVSSVLFAASLAGQITYAQLTLVYAMIALPAGGYMLGRSLGQPSGS
ncbi:hypothetical protein [Halobaculum rubrum]|uniref:hypothetical protein n=1 Tax=Halobaculum rubrum TaxID=2872158 RepID=UPI001CA3A1BE|nr:hypothetical protein [Halobaculum rubrum]QZY01218.1 hypothetical protein K6T25_15270 [Halobaculum rubrum]